MSKRCALTGKSVATGNNVSHAVNKTRRRFYPNLQRATLISDALRQRVSLKISTRALRTIEVNGGLDRWLLDTNNSKLTPEAKTLKKRIIRAQ